MSKRETFHNGEKDNSSRRPSNTKCICTNKRTSKDRKLKLSELKEEIDISWSFWLFICFEIVALSVNRSTRQKISKATEDLKNTIH